MKENKKFIVVEECDAGMRIDIFLCRELELSRSHINILRAQQNVFVNDIPAKKSGAIIKAKDVIKVIIPELKPLSLLPENIPLNIIYEDDYIAVINKQRGLVVHPAQGSESGTLVNALLYHLKNLSGINGVIRPGIVHRLDKDTTGLLVVAKTDDAHISLSSQISSKTCRRIYEAIVDGIMLKDKGIIDASIARCRVDRKKMTIDSTGRTAVTEYKVLERFKAYTHVEYALQTGRTHQIRVHSKFIGYPIIGDKLYNSKKDKFNLQGQLLHARCLEFNHPITNERMSFTAPRPLDFENVLKILRNI